MAQRYVYKDQKKLRCGYTTGTCAAMAAKASALALLSGDFPREVSLTTPAGSTLTLPLLETERTERSASCAVRKDSGDDPDVTDGILVFARVERDAQKNTLVIDGGTGVGRVTKPGLDQPVGAAAINRVPRQMIRDAVEEVRESLGREDGLRVIISIPEGEALAKRTFNPRLGIEGGLSVLGTTGIVEPMSEQALVDTIRTECRMRRASGETRLLLTPGSYGADFLKRSYPRLPQDAVKCGNFIGDAVDIAAELGFSECLLIGHIGKLCKLASGIFQTHSRYADGRMESLVSCGLIAGVPAEVLRAVLDCAVADAALELLRNAGMLSQTMDVLLRRIQAHLDRRAGERLRTGALVFSHRFGTLGATAPAEQWLEEWT